MNKFRKLAHCCLKSSEDVQIVHEPNRINKCANLCKSVEMCSVRAIKLFLRKGANPNKLFKDLSAMHLVFKHSVEKILLILHILLEYGGDANVRNRDGITPIHLAANYGYCSILLLLIRNGGDVLIKDFEGMNAMDNAYQSKCDNCIRIIENELNYDKQNESNYTTLINYDEYLSGRNNYKLSSTALDVDEIDCNNSKNHIKSNETIYKTCCNTFKETSIDDIDIKNPEKKFISPKSNVSNSSVCTTISVIQGEIDRKNIRGKIYVYTEEQNKEKFCLLESRLPAISKLSHTLMSKANSESELSTKTIHIEMDKMCKSSNDLNLTDKILKRELTKRDIHFESIVDSNRLFYVKTLLDYIKSDSKNAELISNCEIFIQSKDLKNWHVKKNEIDKGGDADASISTDSASYLNDNILTDNAENIKDDAHYLEEQMKKLRIKSSECQDYAQVLIDTFSSVNDYSVVENDMESSLISSFNVPGRKWREGNLKSSFVYILLDPRVLSKLNITSKISFNEKFKSFINSIFYIGKGKQSRSYDHFRVARRINQEHNYEIKEKEKLSPKVKKICEIWKANCGVISLHVFHHCIAVEAYTREACMIMCMGLQNLTNIRQGQFYGVSSIWDHKKRTEFGLINLIKSFNILQNEGERQIYPIDI
ncbi:hypothetical protein A3Q56_05927 [Intoshia linei]|uniref:Uncharacterized protein n=1 Tax=Intoshia linei TaxID=1819745 RepID=A0A177AY99_9BILA|nr:hypothetical protein A3Q56_05927 [Intoshia linei]